MLATIITDVDVDIDEEDLKVIPPDNDKILEVFTELEFRNLAKRITGEEIVVTATGCEVITKFPAEELLVAGQRYFTTGGFLNTTRDSQSHLNTSTFNHIGNGK